MQSAHLEQTWQGLAQGGCSAPLGMLSVRHVKHTRTRPPCAPLHGGHRLHRRRVVNAQEQGRSVQRARDVEHVVDAGTLGAHLQGSRWQTSKAVDEQMVGNCRTSSQFILTTVEVLLAPSAQDDDAALVANQRDIA